jgi:hypothetical protein
MNNFYVYAHLHTDGTPFYVGKGHGNRAYVKASRSNWWKNIVNKEYNGAFPEVKLLEEGLDEDTSLEREMFWISQFGRKKVHQKGTLVNHTDGGDGLINPDNDVRYKIGSAMRGKKHTIQTRKLMSRVHSGNPHPISEQKYEEFCNKQSILKKGNKNMLGKHHSTTSKKKMSLAQKGKTISDDIRNKISIGMGAIPTYLRSPLGDIVLVVNQSEFARQHDLIPTKVSELIRGKSNTHKGWTLYISKGK